MAPLSLTQEVYTFYNVEAIPIAAGRLHPERSTFHRRPVDADHIVVSIEEVFENGVSFYIDPIEEDNIFCSGQLALWMKKFVAATSDTEGMSRCKGKSQMSTI